MQEETLKKRVEAYQKAFQKERKTLIVFGGVGVWKTYLVKHHTPEPVDYFIDEPTFKQQIVAGNMKLAPNDVIWSSRYVYPLECLTRKALVCFDDLGCSGHTEAYIEKMLYWVNIRIAKWLRTIVTTNLTQDDFANKYEKRLSSRLHENALCLLIQGEDLRKKSALYYTI